MKKYLTTIILTMLSPLVLASGGFQDNSTSHHHKEYRQSGLISSVKEALSAKDDARVSIEGQIVKQLDHDDFIFRDVTGEIEIEVNKKAWQGQNITPTDKIRIEGKVDKDHKKTEIEVYKIIKL